MHPHDTKIRHPDVDKGEATDLASVPWVIWNLIASYGRQTLPAILHDQRCVEARRLQTTDPKAALALRRHADGQFRRALIDQDVDQFHAWAMWTAVSFAAHSTHCPAKLAYLAMRLLLQWGFVAWSVWGGGGWKFAAAALIPFLGPEPGLVWSGALLLPLFGPIVAVQGLFAGAVKVVAALQWAIGDAGALAGLIREFRNPWPRIEPLIKGLLRPLFFFRR